MDTNYLKTFITEITKAKSLIAEEGRASRYLELNPTDHTFILTQTTMAGVSVIGGGLSLSGVPSGPSPQVALNKFKIIDAEGTVAFDSSTL